MYIHVNAPSIHLLVRHYNFLVRALVSFLFVKVGHCFACIDSVAFKKIFIKTRCLKWSLNILLAWSSCDIVFLGDLKARRLCLRMFSSRFEYCKRTYYRGVILTRISQLIPKFGGNLYPKYAKKSIRTVKIITIVHCVVQSHDILLS